VGIGLLSVGYAYTIGRLMCRVLDRSRTRAIPSRSRTGRGVTTDLVMGATRWLDGARNLDRGAGDDYQGHYQVGSPRLSIQAMRITPPRRSVIGTLAITGGRQMFPMAYSTPLFAGRSQDQAHEIWRDAASLVATRWQVFLESEPQSRAWAFASYVAALDAEEAAAADMAALSSSIAA
jgi:hypothetical protein